MLQPTDKQRSAKMEWVNKHTILSVSVCSNIPDYTEPKCFVRGDHPNVVAACLEYLTEMSQAAYRQLYGQYVFVFEEIDRRINSDVEDGDDKNIKSHYLHKMSEQLDRYLQELPVIGFNSGKFDINAMKIDFFEYLADQNMVKYVIKPNNNFMCVKTEKLKFLDIVNYLAPGFNYQQFLKAYGADEEKGYFAYEWMTSLDKLDATTLPPHEAFFSTLKNSNITKDEYDYCQAIFKGRGMTSMKDFLIWYNNKDVEPMLQALEKMFQFYQSRKIDMFKDGVSVPGLTMKYLFQDLPVYFTLPNEKYKDVYRMLKDNIVGGPSIVFHRYHEKDITHIRPAEYDDPKPCKKVVGFDANALYLWSIMQDMPTGNFIYEF